MSIDIKMSNRISSEILGHFIKKEREFDHNCPPINYKGF